ncbi:DMT family transporter [Hyphococcus flavus]|uniref:DMT family transporter n=1 Tax=Hyphococcus flavus TaxID=1866326 RepID=A0AAE9ZDA0_9PROT|nr:DMT family transporter [Hyphococcus flavus]WDI30377.1 DMT family transporter [Hyphococcus flavus]
MTLREISALLLMCLVWGFHFVVIKLIVGEVPPMFYAAVRLALVALLLSPFLRWRRGEMARVLFGGLCFGVFNYAFMFSGVKLAPASAAAIAIELHVPFATIMAMIFLGDRPGWRRLVGMALAFTGVAIIATAGPSSPDPETRIGVGVGLVAAAAFTEAIGAVLVKRATAFTPHQLLAWFSLVGVIGLTIMTTIFETGQVEAYKAVDKWLFAGAVLYSAVAASIIGHSTYYWLLHRLPVSVVAPSVLLTTMFAVFFSVALLGDPFGPRMAVGGLLTIAGVGVVLLRNIKKQPHTGVLAEPPG